MSAESEPLSERLSDDFIRAMLSDPKRAPKSSQTLGFSLIDYSPDEGWFEAQFEPNDNFTNPLGSIQGGFVAAMLDDCMALAALVKLRFSHGVPTLQMSINYLRPVFPGKVRCRGEVVRLSRTAAFMAGSLFDARGKLAATASATALLRPFPENAGPKGSPMRG